MINITLSLIEIIILLLVNCILNVVFNNFSFKNIKWKGTKKDSTKKRSVGYIKKSNETD